MLPQSLIKEIPRKHNLLQIQKIVVLNSTQSNIIQMTQHSIVKIKK